MQSFTALRRAEWFFILNIPKHNKFNISTKNPTLVEEMTHKNKKEQLQLFARL